MGLFDKLTTSKPVFTKQVSLTARDEAEANEKVEALSQIAKNLDHATLKKLAKASGNPATVAKAKMFL